MASDESEGEKPRKAGLFGRLFGRGEAPAPEPAPAPAPPPEAVVAPAPAPEAARSSAEAPKKSWWERLRGGLSRSSSAIGQGITDIFTKRKLDAAMLDELEDVLIQADLGVTMATRIRDAVGKGRFEKDIEPGEVKNVLASEVEAVLFSVSEPLSVVAGDESV